MCVIYDISWYIVYMNIQDMKVNLFPALKNLNISLLCCAIENDKMQQHSLLKLQYSLINIVQGNGVMWV